MKVLDLYRQGGRRHRVRLDFGWFVHRASRYYYLFFYYLSYYLYMCSLSPEDRGSTCSLSPETDRFNVFTFTVENCPESQ